MDKDEHEAFRWYKKSADQGWEGGQFFVGWCYCNGMGVLKNEEEGLKWLQKAAKQGNDTAQRYLNTYLV